MWNPWIDVDTGLHTTVVQDLLVYQPIVAERVKACDLKVVGRQPFVTLEQNWAPKRGVIMCLEMA